MTCCDYCDLQEEDRIIRKEGQFLKERIGAADVTPVSPGEQCMCCCMIQESLVSLVSVASDA